MSVAVAKIINIIGKKFYAEDINNEKELYEWLNKHSFVQHDDNFTLLNIKVEKFYHYNYCQGITTFVIDKNGLIISNNGLFQ